MIERKPPHRTWRTVAPPRVNSEPRLHVNTGAYCNNNCAFCAEDDRLSRARMISAQTAEQLYEILGTFPSRSHVCFTTGEPTLNPLLPWLIRSAAELGYHEVALITNGRRLSDDDYLHRLLDAGLNLLMVSIHGPTPKLHDGLTRAPGSFAQTARAIKLAAPLVRVHTSTVVNLRNLRSLKQLIALLARLGVDQVVLNVVKPRGRADVRAERLLAPYGDVVSAVANALASLGDAAPPVFLEDVPPCATESLPATVRGVLEHNLRYDLVEGEDGLSYEEFDRARTEGSLRAKRPECRKCRYDAACPGVWSRYIDVHGWAGLRPVEDFRG